MRNYSPRVAILGSQTFSQEGHSVDDRLVKIADEPSNTVVKQVERMKVSCNDSLNLVVIMQTWL